MPKIAKKRKTEFKAPYDKGYVKPQWAKKTNWYKMCDNGEHKYRNPRAHLHGITHPARMIVCGPTGSGKTQLLLDILRLCDNIDEIYCLTLFGKEDALYKLLEENFNGKKCLVTDDIHEFPDVTSLPTDDDIQRFFIFDDCIAMQPAIQKKIIEYFITMRKKNGSGAYLSQSFFDTPKVIRKQGTQIFLLPGLTKINEADFDLIAARFGNVQDIKQMYDLCEKQKEQFWIDCLGPVAQRFRIGFDRVFAPNAE